MLASGAFAAPDGAVALHRRPLWDSYIFTLIHHEFVGAFSTSIPGFMSRRPDPAILWLRFWPDCRLRGRCILHRHRIRRHGTKFWEMSAPKVSHMTGREGLGL